MSRSLEVFFRVSITVIVFVCSTLINKVFLSSEAAAREENTSLENISGERPTYSKTGRTTPWTDKVHIQIFTLDS